MTMTPNFLLEAIQSLAPNCQFSIFNFDYSTLVWNDENELPPPTKEEIETEIKRFQAEYDYNQYQRDRASAYPSIQEQLDTLYHQGYDGWKETINKVKEEYPKPE